MGWYSIHFDPVAPYVDHSTTPKSWAFNNGTHPQRFMFEDWSYNETTRNFIGSAKFPSPYFGLSKYVYNLTFSKDFTEIEEGIRHGYDTTGKLTDSETHQTGGLTAYEYIIEHKVKPFRLDLECQAIRQKDFINEIDNMLIYYTIDKEKFEQDQDHNMKLKIIRDSNETSLRLAMTDKLLFVDIHEF